MTTKINVFFHRNTVNDEADVMSSGRLFLRPAEAHDCSPTVTRHDGHGQTVSWLEVDDRSQLLDGM